MGLVPALLGPGEVSHHHIAALILFGFVQTLSSLEDLAANAALTVDELHDLKQSPALHSGGGLLAILLATGLAVYKPWGMTPYGRRQRNAGVGPGQERKPARLGDDTSCWESLVWSCCF